MLAMDTGNTRARWIKESHSGSHLPSALGARPAALGVVEDDRAKGPWVLSHECAVSGIPWSRSVTTLDGRLIRTTLYLLRSAVRSLDASDGRRRMA